MGILFESRHYAATRKELSKRFPGSDIGPVILGHKVCQNLTDIVDVRGIKNDAIDASQCEYGDLYQQYFDALRWISFSLQKQFPDRPAQKLTFLDLGCRFGMCPNHPTHTGARCGDIQPYTLGPNNYTQKGDPRQQIWRPDGSLDLTVFDVERNARLILMLSEAFPSLTEKQPILMHSKIRHETHHYLLLNGLNSTLITQATRADDGYNHDKHFHCEFYGPVNKEMAL